MRVLRFADVCERDLLTGIHPPFGGQQPSLGHALLRERQDLERVALRAGCPVLFDPTLADPVVHGTPRGVGVAAEARLGEVAVGDRAEDADVGQRSGAAFGEGDGPRARSAAYSRRWPFRMRSQLRLGGAAGHGSGSAVRPNVSLPLTGQRLGPRLRSGTGSFGTGTWIRWGSRRGRADRRHGDGVARCDALAVPNEHEVGDLLRVRGGAPDLARVLFERLDPALDVGRAPARVVADADALAGHHGADLGPEFLPRVLGDPNPPSMPWMRVSRFIRSLCRCCGPARGARSGSSGWRRGTAALGQHDLVPLHVVVGAVARDVADRHAAVLHDPLGLLVDLPERLGGGVRALGQPVGLLGVEDGVLRTNGALSFS